MKFKFAVLLLIAVIAAPAAILETSHVFDIPVTNTNWLNNSAIAIPQYNGSGTLLSVTFDLTGYAKGILKFENIDGENTSSVDSSLWANVTLYRPGGTQVIVIASPKQVFTDNLTTFDGTLNYGGTSGRDHSIANLINATESEVYDTAEELAIFTGSSTIYLPVGASGLTSVQASGGDVVSNFSTQAAAHLKITYEYELPTPEPGVFAMVGSALIALGVVFRRRQARA